MKLKHLLLSALMLLSAGSAWADVEINETNFPDANFRKYLLRQDYGNDGKLTDVEIAGVNEIYIFNSSIQTLQGIEYFTALTRLECFSNQLTSLDVSGCTALEELICNDNQLTSLDVSKNTKLRGLYCENNQLTSLDVSKNTALKYLICSSNPITSLDVSKNTSLIKLSCSNTMLTVLNCNDNQLAELYVLNNAVLTELQCNGNQLTSLDVSGCTALTLLSCYGNKLKSIDISECTVLTELYCGSNKLTSLDVSKNTALTVLSCYSNQLTSLDVSKNTKLKTLDCYQSQINGDAMDALVKSLPTGNNSTMRVITIGKDKNVMTTTQVAAAKAKGWTPYYTTNGEEWTEYAGIAPAAIIISEENFPDENFRIWLTNQEYGKDAVLTDEEIAGISEMYVGNRGIKSLQGIECFTELTRLWCYGNKLPSLDVSKNTKLTDLSCGDNQLTSLDMSKNKALTNLDCHYNLLTSLDLSKNTAITVLSCYGNQLTSLDVSKNTALTTLYCYSNQLTSIDLSVCNRLTYLSCHTNQLASLDVSKCYALTTIYCYHNKIKGDDMNALIEGLPTRSNRWMDVIYYTNEQNEITTTQVAAAKAKGWTPRYTTDGYDWKEYAGIVPSAVTEVKTDASDSAPWYTVNGVKLTEKPTAPGFYIHGGKKVIVK